MSGILTLTIQGEDIWSEGSEQIYEVMSAIVSYNSFAVVAETVVLGHRYSG